MKTWERRIESLGVVWRVWLWNERVDGGESEGRLGSGGKLLMRHGGDKVVMALAISKWWMDFNQNPKQGNEIIHLKKSPYWLGKKIIIKFKN